MAWISQREFAAIIGVSAPAVCQSLKRGRLQGATRVRDGKTQIESEKGVKLWNDNNARPDLGGRKTGTDLAKPPKPKAEPAKKTSPAAKPKPAAAKPKPKKEPEPPHDEPVVDIPEHGLLDVNVSRRRAEYYKAAQAELDYRKQLGEYVLVEDVAKEVEKEYEALGAKLKAIKIPLAQELIDHFGAGDLLEIQDIIGQYINEALTELSDPHANGTPEESPVGTETAA